MPCQKASSILLTVNRKTLSLAPKSTNMPKPSLLQLKIFTGPSEVLNPHSFPILQAEFRALSYEALLGGSWDLVSKVISTLIGVISIVTLTTTLVTKSHDPLSRSQPGPPSLKGASLFLCRGRCCSPRAACTPTRFGRLGRECIKVQLGVWG